MNRRKYGVLINIIQILKGKVFALKDFPNRGSDMHMCLHFSVSSLRYREGVLLSTFGADNFTLAREITTSFYIIKTQIQGGSFKVSTSLL